MADLRPAYHCGARTSPCSPEDVVTDLKRAIGLNGHGGDNGDAEAHRCELVRLWNLQLAANWLSTVHDGVSAATLGTLAHCRLANYRDPTRLHRVYRCPADLPVVAI